MANIFSRPLALSRRNRQGNLTYDPVEQLHYEYNELNLPSRIFGNNGEVRYIYNSEGQKLATLTNGSFTYYRSVMVYGGITGGNEQLQYMIHPEGTIQHNNGQFAYNYHLTDYAGNVRQVAAADNASSCLVVQQEMNYYPFGLAHNYNNLHRNRYLFTGKELQDQTIGNSGFLGLYDFGARYYNPMLGRWFNTDPAQQTTNPYLFCGNAPMAYIDKDGQFFFTILASIFCPVLTPMTLGLDAGMMNGGMKSLAQGGSFWNGALSGALAVGISMGVGSAVGAALPVATNAGGFIRNGAITGLSSGFAGGLVGSSIDAWSNGANFGQGLKTGLIGGGIGGAAGWAWGGIKGAIQFSNLNKLFLTIESPSGITNSDGSLIRSNETLKTYNDTYFSQATYYDMAKHVYDHDAVTTRNKNALAHTDPNKVNGKYMVRYADGAFDDKLSLWISMGHEYVHVSQYSSGLPFSRGLYEGGAYQWQKNVMSKAGLQNNSFYTQAKALVDSYSRTTNNFLKRLSPYMPGHHGWNLPTAIPGTVLK